MGKGHETERLGSVLKPLRRLWCKVTMQSRLVLELQTIDSQAHIGKNRESRLLKSEGSGHLLVHVFCQKKGSTKRLEEIGGKPRSTNVPLRTGYAQ